MADEGRVLPPLAQSSRITPTANPSALPRGATKSLDFFRSEADAAPAATC